MIYHFFNKLPIISLKLILPPLRIVTSGNGLALPGGKMGNGWILTFYHASVTRGYYVRIHNAT